MDSPFRVVSNGNNIIISNEKIVIKFYKNEEEKYDELKAFDKLKNLNIQNICLPINFNLEKGHILTLYGDKKNDSIVQEILGYYEENMYLVFKNIGKDLTRLNNENLLPSIDIMYEGLHKITSINEQLIQNNIVYGDFKPNNIIYDKEKNDFYLIDYGIAYFLDEKLSDLFDQPFNLFNTFFLSEPYLYFGPEIYILSFNNYFKKQNKEINNCEYITIKSWSKKHKGKWFDELISYFNPHSDNFIYKECVTSTNSDVYKIIFNIFNLEIVQTNIKKLIMYTRHRSLFNPFDKLKKNFGMFGLGITYLCCAFSYNEECDLKEMMIEEAKEIIIDSMNYSRYI